MEAEHEVLNVDFTVPICYQGWFQCRFSPWCNSRGNWYGWFASYLDNCKKVRGTVVGNTYTNVKARAIEGPCPPLDGQELCLAIVYEHPDFKGWSTQFPEGNYEFKDFKKQGAQNDAVSSIKVFGRGCVATLYQHGDYTGWHAAFGPGSYSLSDFLQHGAKNDDASAIIVRRGGTGLLATQATSVNGTFAANASAEHGDGRRLDTQGAPTLI